jgi:hypothetical protein
MDNCYYRSSESRRNGVTASGQVGTRPKSGRCLYQGPLRTSHNGEIEMCRCDNDFLYTYSIEEARALLACFYLPHEGPSEMQIRALLHLYPRLTRELIESVYSALDMGYND